MTNFSFNVGNESDLNTAISAIDVGGVDAGTGNTYTITLTASITLDSALEAINLESGASLTIDGGGYALDGAGTYRGLFVYAGTVTAENLTIQNAHAVGGGGGAADAGGGGAGLGGGLFVAAAGNVTLDNVTFSTDAATGGAGGAFT
jgi:hypothetical protein